MTIIEQLAEFITQAETKYGGTKWLRDNQMQVYIRKGYHSIISGKSAITLDIANVIVDEDKQRQGIWSAFLEKAQELNPWDAVYVECVHNPILANSLIRRGWLVAPNSGGQSFFMPKDIDKYYRNLELTQKFNSKVNLNEF